MIRINTLLLLILSTTLSQAQPEILHIHGPHAQISIPHAEFMKIIPLTLMQINYPTTYIIKNTKSFEYLHYPFIKSVFITNQNSNDPHDLVTTEYKDHVSEIVTKKDSIIIVYPEDQNPSTTSSCNSGVTEPQTTTPHPATGPEDGKDSTSTIWPPEDLSTTQSTPEVTTSTKTSTEHPSTTSKPITTPSTTANPATSTTLRPYTTKEPKTTSQFPTASVSEITTKPTTTSNTKPPDGTPTTSSPWTSTTLIDRTQIPTTRPITPPPVNDPFGTMQCHYDGLYPANDYTCDQYFACIHGIRYLMNCPLGLAFNDEKKCCDWPGNVEGCNPRAFDDFACPNEVNAEDNGIYKYRYRQSCSQFIACYREKPRLLSCENGLFFDEYSKDCVYFKNVADCENVYYRF